MALMASKYAGKCKKCGTRYSVGDQIVWTRATGALCVGCGQVGTPAPAPEAPTAVSDGPTVLPRQSGEGTHSVRIWESFADYVESAKSVKPQAGEGCWYTAKPQFYGTDSWDDAVKLADNGWAEVRPQVDALVEKIDADVAPMLRPAFESYFDVSGGGVDVGRFLAGEPECMVETRLVKVAKPGRVVTLLISGGFLAAATQDAVIERGCAIVALVDSLEKMQHGTEIWLEMSCAREFGGRVDKMPVLTHLVKLKSAEDALDIDMLMFAIAHPSRHRRITFAMRRGEPSMGEYGVPYEATTVLTQTDRVNASLVLESLSYAGKTITGAEWVRERLSEFGLVAEEGE